MHVYFGSFTKDRDEGIYRGALDMQTGELKIVGGVGGTPNPSFLVLGPDGKHLYATTESREQGGGAAAFAVDAQSGDLTLINSQPSGSGGTCHIGLDPAGTTAILSDYGGGSVASFPILDDGGVGPVASFIKHADTSGSADKKWPRAHCTKVAPGGRFALTTDLGLDQVIVYRLDSATGQMTAHDQPPLDLKPGAGPRHLTFYPEKPWVYLINELDSTLAVLNWDAEAGTLSIKQTVGTLPDDFQGDNSTAEVVVHPNGRFLYGSNRGHDSIVTFAIDPDTGLLSRIGFEPTGGKHPRNFNVDPTGSFLIACNMHSDNVQVFRIDQESGKLTPVGEPVTVPTPSCVTFLVK